MKISNILQNKETTLSYEVFPPKTFDNYEAVETAVKEIASLRGDFVSVTYGAGGGTSQYTMDIASTIKALGGNAIAHLTSVSSTKEEIDVVLDKLKERGIENVLALRGDFPDGVDTRGRDNYAHACQLMEAIKKKGDFCIGGACYPEGHPESKSLKQDVESLKYKVDAGCDFLTTQMFFDNNIFYDFRYRALKAGVDVPIIAGIMPVTNPKQIERICSLSRTVLPLRFIKIVEKFGDNPLAMKQAGIAYACEQIIDLVANGVRGVHVYTMNKPEVAKGISDNLSDILC